MDVTSSNASFLRPDIRVGRNRAKSVLGDVRSAEFSPLLFGFTRSEIGEKSTAELNEEEVEEATI